MKKSMLNEKLAPMVSRGSQGFGMRKEDSQLPNMVQFREKSISSHNGKLVKLTPSDMVSGLFARPGRD